MDCLPPPRVLIVVDSGVVVRVGGWVREIESGERDERVACELPSFPAFHALLLSRLHHPREH